MDSVFIQVGSQEVALDVAVNRPPSIYFGAVEKILEAQILQLRSVEEIDESMREDEEDDGI